MTEIPYQVNKSTLIEKIAHAVRDKKIEGISDLRDESDRDGMRIVLELRRDAVPEVTKNQLFKYTQLQQTFGVNTVALVQGRPKTLGLKEIIRHYVDHRHVIVVRRTEFELRKAEERAHILEGLTVALDHLDAIIAIIRQSEDTDAAKANLMAGLYPQRLTAEQRDRLGLPAQSPVEITGPREAQGYALTREDFHAQPVAVRRPGRRHPGAAPLAPDRPGARQDRGRVRRDPEAEIERLQSILATRTCGCRSSPTSCARSPRSTATSAGRRSTSWAAATSTWRT